MLDQNADHLREANQNKLLQVAAPMYTVLVAADKNGLRVWARSFVIAFSCGSTPMKHVLFIFSGLAARTCLVEQLPLVLI